MVLSTGPIYITCTQGISHFGLAPTGIPISPKATTSDPPGTTPQIPTPLLTFQPRVGEQTDESPNIFAGTRDTSHQALLSPNVKSPGHHQKLTQIPDGEFSVYVPLSQHIGDHAGDLPSSPRNHNVGSNQYPTMTRSGHTSRMPSRLRDYHLNMAKVTGSTDLPTTIQEALAHPGWHVAMQSKIASIHKNQT